MNLQYFKTPQDALKFLTEEFLCDLREEHAKAIGLSAELYTDDEFYALEGKIADIEAIAPLLVVQEAA